MPFGATIVDPSHKDTTGAAARSKAAVRPQRVGGESVALLLLTDEKRRRHVQQAIEIAGWHVLACASVGEAIKQLDRWRTQLAVVELAASSDPHRDTVRRFVDKHLSAQPRGGDTPLVVISDEQATPADELWARQAGVWLYLPEMEAGDDLSELCREALRSVRKQAAASPAV